jgi:hypothetical protein
MRLNTNLLREIWPVTARLNCACRYEQILIDVHQHGTLEKFNYDHENPFVLIPDQPSFQTRERASFYGDLVAPVVVSPWTTRRTARYHPANRFDLVIRYGNRRSPCSDD